MQRLAAIFAALSLLALCQCEDTKLRGHLEPFGQQGSSTGVDEVEGFLPPREFFEKFVLPNKPVVFKGAAKLSPAFTKWTDENLKERTPPRPVGDVFIEHNKKENRSQSYNFVHFSKFLDTYNTSNIYMVSDVPSFLLEDLVLPFPLQCSRFLKGDLDTHVVWFSSGGTSSVIHHDTYENINCLYRGRKKIVFVNSNKYKAQVDKILDREDGGFSSVDVDKIDLNKRPEFGKVDFHVATMETGDCLYIPYLWVHQVRSFENNLAVNIWWPKLANYDLKKCSKEYNTNITFNKVFFKTLEQQTRRDAELVQRTVEVNMNIKDYETSEDFVKLVCEGSAKLESDAAFVAAAKALFNALDLNKDGKFTADDVNKKMKRKEYRPIRDAADNYNVEVYRIREASKGAGDKLPKYFKTSTSDEGVFGVEQTWPVPGDEGSNEDEEDNEGESPVEEDNPAGGEVKKDEL